MCPLGVGVFVFVRNPHISVFPQSLKGEIDLETRFSQRKSQSDDVMSSLREQSAYGLCSQQGKRAGAAH